MLKKLTAAITFAILVGACGGKPDAPPASSDQTPNGLISGMPDIAERQTKPVSAGEMVMRLREKYALERETRSMEILTEAGMSEDAKSGMDRCVEDLRFSGMAARVCGGLFLSSCPGMEGSTTDMVGCNGIEYDYWDARLNAAYGDVMAVLKEEDEAEAFYDPDGVKLAEIVRDAQRKWMAYRDAVCAFERMRFRGGTMGRITGTSCMREKTAERALELEVMLSDLDVK